MAEQVYFHGQKNNGHEFIFQFEDKTKKLVFDAEALWHFVKDNTNAEDGRQMPLLLTEALATMEKKAGEHNVSNIQFKDYCPFGLVSAATLLHREALRVCACAARDDQEGVFEHLVDTVVFAVLMSEYLLEQRQKEKVK